ncbi:unnamed protein product [Clonostachys byssicola]|uniref:Cytochrome P450 n=1 Tax=Clonostachys byssicola TaxID=160290 RepID=A0A9N9Y1J7_9HYPO|nr:unnamed protein product [Clonostachys byssicola]
MRLPGARIYVVNEASLIPVVQKRIRSLSFSPILVEMSARVVGVTRKTWDIINRDFMNDDSLISGMHTITHQAMSPGPKLDLLTRNATRFIQKHLDDYASQRNVTISLKAWVDHQVIMSTTDCFYGAHNPFRGPNVEALWHDYETGIVPLLISIFPSITAAKHVRARRILVEAFESYFTHIRQADTCDASALITERFELYQQNGIPIPDIARIEVGQALGLISNMKPAAFWLLYHVFSDKIVLQDCRAELSRICTEKNAICTINIRNLSQSCPVLASTFQEVLRFHGTGVSPRMVVEDERLNGQYLLKKGAVVLIPAWVQHRDRGNWGDEADVFNHKRFVREPCKKRSHNPAAFRGFGGGATLCPGRHFATAEVVTLAALVIHRFDMDPVEGRWTYPKATSSKPGIAVHQPDGDLRLTLSRRCQKEWAVQA